MPLMMGAAYGNIVDTMPVNASCTNYLF